MKASTNTAVLFIAAALCFYSEVSLAATRTIYFSQTGRNVATSAGGVGSPVQSFCRITISNPSTQSQQISIRLEGVSTGSFPSNPVSNPPQIGNNVSLAGNATLIYSFAYPTFTAGTPGTQQLLCKGQITAADPTSSGPGYVVATGTLTTFNASATIQTTGVPGAPPPVLGGPAVFTQIPVAINRGKPF